MLTFGVAIHGRVVINALRDTNGISYNSSRVEFTSNFEQVKVSRLLINTSSSESPFGNCL